MSIRRQYLAAEVPTRMCGSPKRDALREEPDKRGRERWGLVGIIPSSPHSGSKPLMIPKKGV